MAPAEGVNARLLQQQKYGFWVRTKQAPHKAVRWEPTLHEDGRASYRGRNWVEVLPHGSQEEPQRFFGADVESAGPHEWLEYYPAATEPVCGWGRPRLPHGSMQYCPRHREAGEPFCRKHMAELRGEGADGADQEAQRSDTG